MEKRYCKYTSMIQRKRHPAFPVIKILASLLLLVLVTALIFRFLSGNKNSLKESRPTTLTAYPTTATYSGTFTNSLVVEYKPDGFVPNTLKISSGTKVTFTNVNAQKMWVASDPHPVHNGLADFDQLQAVDTGGNYTFTFNKTGNFGYHNHLLPSDKGLIIVEK